MPAPGRGVFDRPAFAVAGLGLSQIIGYGTLYYSFGILAPAMARDLGWPQEHVFGALSAALLIGGLVAPASGRLIDRLGAGRVMAAGSAAAALALCACAAAPSGTLFVPALIAIEVAATCVQYGAAFPLLVQRHGPAAQRSIVHLTLIAGFASTLFWPLTSWLHETLSWRAVYLVFAAFNAFVALPIHLALLRAPRRAAEAPAAAPPPAPAPAPSTRQRLAPAARRRGFVLMALAFAAQGFVGSAVLVHMLPLLGTLGLGAAGVAVGVVFGPAQVASRFINMVFGRELSQLALALISAGLQPLALLLLLASAPSFAGAMVFAVLFGMGSGLYSIVGGTLPLALFGAEGYGALQGRVMAVRLIMGAAAPFAFAQASALLGSPATLGLAAALGAGGAAALALIARLPRAAA